MNQSEKEMLRKDLKRKRLDLDVSTVGQNSMLIQKNLVGFLGENKTVYKKIMIYISILKEPILEELYELWLKDGINLYAPVVESETEMSVSPYKGKKNIRPGRLNTLEPIEKALPAVTEFDLILVPGIAFDNSGNRMGLGRGFYDRFLPKTRGLRLGICFDFQLLESIPHDSKDIGVEAIVTESRFLSCSKQNGKPRIE